MKVKIVKLDKHLKNLYISDKEIIGFVKDSTGILAKKLKITIPDISIIFVDKIKIKALNKKYRNIDKATDVLSFKSDEVGYLGDIIIAKEVVYEYSKKFSCSFIEELKRDILHGTMHLLGFDHINELKADIAEVKDEMLLLQESILQFLNK